MMHIRSRRAPKPIIILLNHPQPPQHVRQPFAQHDVAARLVLPELDPGLVAPVLVPCCAAGGGVFEGWRSGAQGFPDSGEAVVS